MLINYHTIRGLLNTKFFKATSIYTLANIINAIIPFLLMPVLTRYLTPGDYGITAMLQTMVGFIAPFIGLSLHGAIAVKYYHRNEIDFPKYVSTCFFILCGSTLILSIFFVCFYRQISAFTAFPCEWLWTVILICYGQFLVNIVLTILRVQVKAKFYAYIQISQTICNLILSLWFVVVLSFNWQGRVIAQVITMLIFTSIGLILLRKWKLLSFSYDIHYVKDALKFGIPLIPHALSGYFVTMADRFLITNLVGIEATGLYTVGAQVGTAIYILATSFNQAYSPWLYENLSQGNQQIKTKIVKLTYVYFVVILAIAFLFSLGMPIIMQYIVGENFYASKDYIVGIAFAGAFNGMYYMVGNYICYAGKTYILAGVTFSMGVLHVVITYWLIIWLGSIGATYASVITAFLTFLSVWFLSAKVYPMPWRLWKGSMKNFNR